MKTEAQIIILKNRIRMFEDLIKESEIHLAQAEKQLEHDMFPEMSGARFGRLNTRGSAEEAVDDTDYDDDTGGQESDSSIPEGYEGIDR